MSHTADRVSLIIPGAAKCATTSLYVMLKGHPQMCASRIKETNFFSKHDRWEEELDWYHDLFDPQPGQMLFEASPSYTGPLLKERDVAQRIYRYNPAMRFIYMVRNPLDRIVSAYMHAFQQFRTDASLSERLRNNPHLLENSMYFSHITPYIELFGRDRVLILDFEDLIEDPGKCLKNISSFIGIDPGGFRPELIHVNSSLANSKYHPKWEKGWRGMIRSISPYIWRRLTRLGRRKFSARPELTHDERTWIIQTLEKDIDQLSVLMDKRLDHWKQVQPVAGEISS